MIAEKILANKQSKIAEIEIHLFENCNIACGYCSQDHNDAGPNQESFDRKFELAKKYMAKLSRSSTKAKISIMGGELFQDKFETEVWEMYKTLITRLYEEAKKWFPDNVAIEATTNFLFNNDRPLETLLYELRVNNIDLRLKTSWDAKGRPFTDRLTMNYMRNLTLFRPYIESISYCLHKPNIHALLNGEATKLDYLKVAGTELCFDWYIPDGKNDAKYFPTDEECKQALMYIMKKYPDSSIVREMLSGEIGQVQCCSENRILIPANEQVSNCIYLPNQYKNPMNRDTTYDKASTFMMEQGCVECPHLMSCGLYCYAASDYAKRVQSATCFIREAYEQSISERDSNK